ncbi:exonuclease SbcCD subunit D [Parashewanella curva]|uniref:Nuclease SbcCD subunit D n=1 Tax=Parashewanella curva TaxID=2338552 RepID=A0A3L8PYQ5_9GAMM|nr:exonuclease SbcCD subunit D [Parashewanella curva]RLV60415.1 exonuclease SbcCD subunit D [Parashewanella curva]
MKFLHTSDWHIGRYLHNQSLHNEQEAVLNQIIELALEHNVDALIVAGDIYDRSVPPATSVELLNKALNQILGLGIQVIMIAGNHDSHQRLGFGSNQMSNSGLHIIGPLTKTLCHIELKGKNSNAIFYTIPYAEPSRVRELFDCEVSTHEQAMNVLLKQIHDHDSKGLPKVVISHCFIDGAIDSESERPLSVGGADKISATLFEPFDYVALGHLHGPQYKGAEHVRYSGSPLKYSFSETNHNKSVTLVEFSCDSNKPEITLLPLTSPRDVRVIDGFLEDIIEQGKSDSNSEDYILVRLQDKHAILDAMGKLRAVYPNVLHLERAGLLANSEKTEIRRQHIKQNEMDMFSSFFTEMTGENLNTDQQALMGNLLEQLHKNKEN